MCATSITPMPVRARNQALNGFWSSGAAACELRCGTTRPRHTYQINTYICVSPETSKAPRDDCVRTSVVKIRHRNPHTGTMSLCRISEDVCGSELQPRIRAHIELCFTTDGLIGRLQETRLRHQKNSQRSGGKQLVESGAIPTACCLDRRR